MNARLTLHLAEYLIDNLFSSKRAMAIATGISYRTLLRLCNGKYSQRDVENVMIGIANYCLQERIAPQALFHGFCPA